VLFRILLSDRAGSVLLQSAKEPQKTARIRERIRRSIDAATCSLPENDCEDASPGPVSRELADGIFGRIRFLPRVFTDDFMRLLASSSVVLHPFPFGGSKTSSDAIAAGSAIVVHPQVYLRGRMAQGFYYTLWKTEELGRAGGEGAEERRRASMDFWYDCCIALSEDEYVEKVLRLGREVGYRKEVEARIKAGRGALFDDGSVSREWIRFLGRVLGADARELGVEEEGALERELDAWIMEDLQMRNGGGLALT
jgi:hypothetical protein